jgi:hypothetical protein
MQQIRNSLDRLSDARADPLRRLDPVDALLANRFHFLERAILRDQGDEERIGKYPSGKTLMPPARSTISFSGVPRPAAKGGCSPDG